MNWSSVGDWIKGNAGTGAALVGSLLTGNVPGAVAAGVALVSSATGTNDPASALQTLQNDPATVIRLRELALQNDASIRTHIEAMERLRLEDSAREHEETGKTIRSGDNAEDRFVRWTRPGQSWLSLVVALGYSVSAESPSLELVALLLALPWAYAGLRQIGKGIDTFKGQTR